MAEIILKNGSFLIDDDDLFLLLLYRKPWINENGYVVMCPRGKGHTKTVRLHRIVMQAPTGMEVDHINGIRTDNRKENLRLCTTAENRRNSRIRNDGKSGYKGVSFFSNPQKRKKRWEAYINVDGKRIKLGYFKTAIEAARAYDTAAKKHFGDYAKINGV